MSLKPERLQNGRQTVIFLMGPTGAGKTDVAIELAGRLSYGIVSVDSALIYRGMDIGTAKPDPATLARIPHRLIDICDPADSYSAARFRGDALREIETLLAAQQVPLLVGGTMLYFRALAQGLSQLPESDPLLRRQLQEQAIRDGWAAMHARLRRTDPEAARRIHPNDPQRILRAIEVFELSGKPLSALQGQMEPLPYNIIRIVISPVERAVLHQRIERRFERMMEQGFLREVEHLYRRGDLGPELPSMRAVGYRQLWSFLAGECDLTTAIQRGITATRQLAKRQLTWLRAEPIETKWIDAGDKNMLDSVLKTLERAQLL
jgi:tRNA dimethylallyltransferase